MRNMRAVILLYGVELPIIASLFVVSLVFTVWPGALEHSPISFEERGLVHHVWHYTLLAGASLVLLGMLWNNRKRLKVELMGTVLLIGATGMNLLAVGTEEGPDAPNGLSIAYRAGILVGLALRAWIIVSEPVVPLGTATTGDA